MDRINELKGAFAEASVIADSVSRLYKTKPKRKKIFKFYRINGLNFRMLPYLDEVSGTDIDRDLSRIKEKLKSNLIIEIRPTEIEYVETGSTRKKFIAKIKIILVDMKLKKVVWSKQVKIRSDIKKAFYKEEKLKRGQSTTPGFTKIKVKFFIENYKAELKKLAEKAAKEIVKLLLRSNRS